MYKGCKKTTPDNFIAIFSISNYYYKKHDIYFRLF